MIIQDIYPSSHVNPEAIAAYGWKFVEDIPTITNKVGRLAPTPERSDTHTALRTELDVEGRARYVASTGEIVEVTDFAVALSPTSAQSLGFFALK